MISTKIVKVDPLNPNEDYLKEASEIIKNGGLVIIPTETVYGIAANRLNKQTIERLDEIKKRPKDRPYSFHIDTKEEVKSYSSNIPIGAWKLIDKFWPGPLTIILKSKGKGNVGIRMPDDEIALRIIGLSAVPVVCPSANLSGQPPPVNFEQAIKDLKDLVDLAIDAGNTRLGVESTVVDLSQDPLCILREGAIKKEDIYATVFKKILLFVCTGNSCRSVMAKALLEEKLKKNKRQDVEVLSAGILMLGGMTVTEATKEILARQGLDVSDHHTQKVTEEMLVKSDIILVMEKMQEERILQLVPAVKNRVFLLKEFAKIDDTNLDIADPIGKPREFYEQTFAVIKEAVERIAQII